MQPRDLETLKSMEEEGEKSALKTNVSAALAVAESVRTALGPKSMDKMLVNEEETVITDSTGTILQSMKLVHPAAKMLAELGVSQREHYGDGTTTSVIIAGELLRRALELHEAGLHPAVIAGGYQLAERKCLEYLERVAIELKQKDVEEIGMSMLRGKVPREYAAHLAALAHAAVSLTRGEKDRVYINYRPGGNIMRSVAFDGIYIDLGKRVHPSMPKRLENASVLLIDKEFDVTEVKDSKVEINSPEAYRRFVEYKRKVLKTAVGMIARSGASALFCSKNIASEAMSFLAQAGILGVRDVEEELMELLAQATGAEVVSNAREVTPEVLGYAGYIEESRIGLEEMMYVKKPKYPNRVASVLVRAGSENLAMELVRKLEDVVEVLARVAREKKMLPGGGATEVELAERLRVHSRRLKGKQQLAVEAYAEALEEIPRLLARSAGMNPLEVLASIKRGHYGGFSNVGFNVLEKKVQDSFENKLLDSYAVKKNALTAATELACSIIRIDDVLLQGDAGGVKEPSQAQQATPQPQHPPPEKFDLKQAFKDLR